MMRLRSFITGMLWYDRLHQETLVIAGDSQQTFIQHANAVSVLRCQKKEQESKYHNL